MLDQTIQLLPFIGLGLGLVAVFCLVEMILRNLTNRYGTPQYDR